MRTTRRWALQRYIAVASVSGLVMMTLVTWRMSRDNELEAVVDIARQHDPSAISLPSAASPELANGTKSSVVETIAEQPSAVQPVVTATTSPIPESAVILAELASTSIGAPLSQQPVIAPPFLNTLVAAESDEPADMLLPAEQMTDEIVEAVEEATIETEMSTASRLAVPTGAELADRPDAWKKFLASASSGDMQAKASRSVKFADEAVGGVKDFWVGMRGAAVYSALANNIEFSDRAVQRLTDRFEIDLAELAKEVAVEAIATPLSASEATNALDWLEAWMGRSLVAGEMDDAACFVANANQLTRSSSDATMSERSKEMTSSLETARRLAEATQRIASNADESLSSSKQLAAGRYWGLIRHQWPKALPYLIAGSDARLASLATTESLLGGSPEPKELIDLAEGYLAFAKKSKGWQKSSYILHASDILSLHAAAGANAQTLDLNRLQKQLRTDHESIFNLAARLTVSAPVPAPVAEQLDETDSKSKTISKTERGLMGRILVDGKDVGVMLHYEPGGRLTTKTLAQIGDRLEFDISAASIQFVGTLVIERPTAITVMASNAIIDGKNSVWLDDHDLTLISAESATGGTASFGADLSPGSWTIRWTVPAVNESGSTFRVIDSLSNMPIQVVNPPQTIKDHPESMKTILRVSMITGQ